MKIWFNQQSLRLLYPILIGTVALAALLLLLLWPIAAALGDALAAIIQAQGDLIASALLVIVLLLTLGLIRIMFAFGRKLDAQADVAAIVRLENEHPVHVADVRQGRAQFIERSLEWHYQVEHLRAERSQLSQLSSLHQAIRMEGTAARGAEAPLPLPEPFRASPHRPLLAQLRERGHVCARGTSLLVGYDASSQPLSIEAAALVSIPRLGTEDLVYAAQGVAPRPYAPRLNAPPSLSAPTIGAVPVAVPIVPVPPRPPVPPTEPLPQPLSPNGDSVTHCSNDVECPSPSQSPPPDAVIKRLNSPWTKKTF